MATWSGIRSKLEKEYLAPSLQGRIQYFAISYHKCPDHEGRAAIRLDGKEVFKSSYYEYSTIKSKTFHETASFHPEFSIQEQYQNSEQTTLKKGSFDQHHFYLAFQEFDNQNIEKSLGSPNPLVKMFALFDRRVGKRKLLALKTSMEYELHWLRFFYYLRLEAEGISLQQS